MKRLIQIALGACLLAGCGGVAPISAEKNAAATVMKADRDAGRITWTQWAQQNEELLGPDMNSFGPAGPQYFAFRRVIAERVDAKKLTPAEGEYELTKARTEANQAANNAVAANRARVGAALQSAASAIQPIQFQSTYQPIYPQQNRIQANCRTMMIGNSMQTNCN